MRGAAVIACIGLAACGMGEAGTSTTHVSTSTSTSTSMSAGASGGSGGGGQCGLCEGACVDLGSDPRHCGECGHACGAQAYCDRGACKPPPCEVQGPICPTDHTCCGGACCPPWKMCCPALDGGAPACVPVDAGACPSTACPACP